MEEHDTEAKGPPFMTLALFPNQSSDRFCEGPHSTFPPYTQDGFPRRLSSSGKVLAKALQVR